MAIKGGHVPSELVWRKSSRSGGGNSNCVQVAALSGGRFGIRDSKAGACGPILMFDQLCFQAFITATKSGAFDLPTEHR